MKCYSGADLQSLVREATLVALGRTKTGEKTLVTEDDFDIALQKYYHPYQTR